MSDDQQSEPSQPFDLFELLTAVLLGLAAIGAALAGLQGGQWGGKQLEAFAESNKMTTKAATDYNEASVAINADYAAVAAAKEHILEARDATDPATKKRHFDLASYYCSSQLNEEAYLAMELPKEYYVEDAPAGQPGAATPAAAAATPATTPAATPAATNAAAPPATNAAAPAAVPAAGGAPAAKAAEEDDDETAADGHVIERDIPDADLLKMLAVELDEEYSNDMLEDANKGFAAAEVRFNEGKVANENGDRFDLIGVFFTVALFFAGVGLVFKTSIRWAFFCIGLLLFVGSSIYMFTLPWAS